MYLDASDTTLTEVYIVSKYCDSSKDIVPRWILSCSLARQRCPRFPSRQISEAPTPKVSLYPVILYCDLPYDTQASSLSSLDYGAANPALAVSLYLPRVDWHDLERIKVRLSALSASRSSPSSCLPVNCDDDAELEVFASGF